MGLFDNLDFAQLFKQLGVRPSGTTGFRLPASTPLAGSDYLNDTEDGAASLFELYTSQFDEPTARTLSRQFQPIYRRYKAASALEPTLTFESFLDKFDAKGFTQNELTGFDRGERPGNFTRGAGGFRYLQG